MQKPVTPIRVGSMPGCAPRKRRASSSRSNAGPVAAAHVANRARDTERWRAGAVVERRGERRVARVREAARDPADVRGEAHDVVDRDDRRASRRAGAAPSGRHSRARIDPPLASGTCSSVSTAMPRRYHARLPWRRIGAAHDAPRRLVDVSQRVAATSARLAKVRELAEVLRALAPDEVEIAVAYLSGEVPQGRIGLGYAQLRDATASASPAAEPTLGIGEVDERLAAFAQIRGAAPRRGAPTR